jgi:hypothetical protein
VSERDWKEVSRAVKTVAKCKVGERGRKRINCKIILTPKSKMSERRRELVVNR